MGTWFFAITVVCCGEKEGEGGRRRTRDLAPCKGTLPIIFSRLRSIKTLLRQTPRSQQIVVSTHKTLASICCHLCMDKCIGSQQL